MHSHLHHRRPPQTRDEFVQYHDIRRRVLWEARRHSSAYDEHHPDEYAPDHFPLLLLHRASVVGVVRVDVSGRTAILRRVAIRDDLHRRGHGRARLALIAAFASAKACDRLYSFVAPDAVGFYLKCGFTRDPNGVSDAQYVPMQKSLTGVEREPG